MTVLDIVLGDGSRIPAHTYLAQEPHIQDGLLPYDWYHDLVVAGAKQHRLPDDHTAMLQASPCKVDSESERRSRTEAIAIVERCKADVAFID